MKKFLPLIILTLIVCGFSVWQNLIIKSDTDTVAANIRLVSVAEAFRNQQRDVQVEGEAEVVRLLKDDLKGSRHQRFIIKTPSGQTILVAHNIDLAPRITALRTGDSIAYFGEYEWNSQGGIIHWTHHDPRGRHIDGWLKHKGVTYQ